MKVESIAEFLDHHLGVLAVFDNAQVHVLQVSVEVLVAPETLYQHSGALKVSSVSFF